MRLLLDTHTLIWAYTSDPKLSATAGNLILDLANQCVISPASYWEIAIKLGTQKLTLTEPFPDFMQRAIRDLGISILPIEPKHCEPLTSLPRHHNDPFDRLLIAQSIVEHMPIVSIDAALDPYGIKRLW
ncbi:type II toxin-antitoxin system VapC family toxin [Anatilimnocola floriformis]|uniref:type II toxin-antitoxin system VapC family toxin n=1 Tax=Anatilimnocola floriformis TaxID=2948575 RepID=UPI0020C4E7C2|nr:type II toxin-antitoxin system VapC family toxin [Anatilimnocola floriformis]